MSVRDDLRNYLLGEGWGEGNASTIIEEGANEVSLYDQLTGPDRETIKWVALVQVFAAMVIVGVLDAVAQVQEAAWGVVLGVLEVGTEQYRVVTEAFVGAPAAGIWAMWRQAEAALEPFGILAPVFGVALFLALGYLLVKEVQILGG